MADITGTKRSQVVQLTGSDEANAVDVVRESGSNLMMAKVKFPNSLRDAFSRMRSSDPVTLFDSKLDKNNQSLFWNESLTGSGTSTWVQNEASMKLSTTTASGDKVIRQTKEYFSYQPAKDQFIVMTFLLGTGKVNVRKRVGYFDDNNGLFLEQDGTTIQLVRRTYVTGSAVDTVVTQANWNLDTLDGAGPTGYTIDFTKIQLFFIDFQWLGAGLVRFGFIIGEDVVYVHQIFTSNTLSTVFMSTPSLPARYEIENTGATASSTDLYAVCVSIISEGATKPLRALNFYKDSGEKNVTKNIRTNLISIRLKSTNIRHQLIPFSVYGVIDVGDYSLFELVLNPTIGGTPSWSSVDSNSATEYDIAGTTVTGGTTIFSTITDGKVEEKSNEFPLSALKVLADIAGTSDILTLAITPKKNNTQTAGGIGWKEPL